MGTGWSGLKWRRHEPPSAGNGGGGFHWVSFERAAPPARGRGRWSGQPERLLRGKPERGEVEQATKEPEVSVFEDGPWGSDGGGENLA